MKPSMLLLYESIASWASEEDDVCVFGEGGRDENEVDAECLYRLGYFCEGHVLMPNNFYCGQKHFQQAVRQRSLEDSRDDTCWPWPLNVVARTSFCNCSNYTFWGGFLNYFLALNITNLQYR